RLEREVGAIEILGRLVGVLSACEPRRLEVAPARPLHVAGSLLVAREAREQPGVTARLLEALVGRGGPPVQPRQLRRVDGREDGLAETVVRERDASLAILREDREPQQLRLPLPQLLGVDS